MRKGIGADMGDLRRKYHTFDGGSIAIPGNLGSVGIVCHCPYSGNVQHQISIYTPGDAVCAIATVNIGRAVGVKSKDIVCINGYAAFCSNSAVVDIGIFQYTSTFAGKIDIIAISTGGAIVYITTVYIQVATMGYPQVTTGFCGVSSV